MTIQNLHSFPNNQAIQGMTCPAPHFSPFGPGQNSQYPLQAPSPAMVTTRAKVKGNMIGRNLLEVADVIGWDKAVTLARGMPVFHRRGKEERILYVPRKANQAHFIAKLIGMEAMEKLCAAMACCVLNIARPELVEQRLAVEGLLEHTALSFKEIARQTGFTEKSVRRRADMV
ncbi:hypothetical protein E3E12_07725 [Formicincola oecophyllae]|uniref:Uncharacterized protein n=1 Tax=Formicincola oecophyllae TaxID=2558361 RepID=A0A4Y6UA46_9PROT|nr:hypothetical protein [Formicincola oecophyllae]QDH14084.1 hypothetical protein E3E12_07725 [Formicincola oecophyllae]